MYDMAKAAKGTKYTDLAILGIGGSRHTTENITKLLGIDEQAVTVQRSTATAPKLSIFVILSVSFMIRFYFSFQSSQRSFCL